MSNQLSGRASLSYRGTEAVNPPNWLIYTRAPTTKDSQNFVLGDLWLNKITREAWILVSLAGNMGSHGQLIAIWLQISKNIIATLTGNNNAVHVKPDGSHNINLIGDGTTVNIVGNPGTNTLTLSLVGGAYAQEITGDSGGAVSPSSLGNINIIGDGTTIVFTGNPLTNTLTASIVNPVEFTITANSGGPVYPDLSGNYDYVGDGTTINIVGNPGTGTLTMSLISSEIPSTLTGDSGGAVHAGAGNNITLLGGGGLLTDGDPGLNLILVEAASSLATTYDTDSGTAFPAGGILDVAGGTNINTSGAGHTVTVNADANLSGITNLTINNLTVNDSLTLGYLTQGVVQSNSSGAVFSSEGTDGQTLISSSVGAPAWRNITAGSNMAIINGNNSITVSRSAAGGNGWVLIGTFGGATGGSITSGITNAYTTLALVFYMGIAPGTKIPNPVTVTLTISDNGGSSYYTSNYVSGVTLRNVNSYVQAPINATSTSGYLISLFNNYGGLATYCSGIVYLYNMTNTNPNKLMNGTGTSYEYSAINTNNVFATGVYTGSLAGPINAMNVVLNFSPSHTFSGSFSLYGLTA